MSRFQELDPRAMNDAQRQLYDRMVGTRGRLPAPYRVWVRHPAFARASDAMGQFFQQGHSLPPRLKELTIIITARHWRAQIPWHAHTALARQAGLDEAIIQAIYNQEQPTFANAEEGVVYDLCTGNFQHARVSDAAFNRAVELLGTLHVIEIIGLIGRYTLVSCTLNTFQVPLAEGVEAPFKD